MSLGLGAVLATAGIGSAISGLGSYFGAREARRAQEDTNAANAALWREQAKYNTPANQMLRYKEAGLNPNLIYGQLSDSNMSSPPTMQPAPDNALAKGVTKGFENFLATAGQLMSLERQKSEIDSVKAETRNKELAGQALVEDIQQKRNDNSLFGITAEMRKADLENKLQHNFNLMQQRYLNKAQYDNLIAENKNIIAQLQVIKKQSEKYGEDILLTRTNRDLLKQKYDYNEMVNPINKRLLDLQEYNESFFNRKGLGAFPRNLNVFNAIPYLFYGVMSQLMEDFTSLKK